MTVPVTMDEVRALATREGGEVSVERVTDSSGGGSCGHTPLCILILPAIFVGALLPPHHDVATVTAGGSVVYQGQFTTEGELLRARGREGDAWIDIERVDLPHLGRHLIVVSYRTPIDTAGDEGTPVPVSLESQIALVSAYRDALAVSSSIELLGEAVEVLGADATVLVVEALEHEVDDGDMSPVAGILERCHWSDAPFMPRLRLAGPLRDRLARAASAHPTRSSALLALQCLEPSSVEPDPVLVALVRGVVEAECARGGDLDRAIAVTGAVARQPLLHRAQAEAAVACSGSLLLQIGAGVDLAEETMENAIAAASASSPDRAVGLLDPAVPSHRRVLHRLLTADLASSVASRLVETETEPTSEDLIVTVRALPRFEGTYRAQNLLRLLASAHASPALTLAARSELSAGPQGVSLDAVVAHLSARLILGDRAALPELAALAVPPRANLLEDVVLPVSGPGELASYALWLAGCSASELEHVPATAGLLCAEGVSSRHTHVE